MSLVVFVHTHAYLFLNHFLFAVLSCVTAVAHTVQIALKEKNIISSIFSEVKAAATEYFGN